MSAFAAMVAGLEFLAALYLSRNSFLFASSVRFSGEGLSAAADG